MRDPKTGTVYVDNTTLGTVARCETAAALKGALGYTVLEEAHALEIGTVTHEIMADYLAQRYNAELCLKKYELLWGPYSKFYALDNVPSPSMPNPHYRLSLTNTLPILREWFERRPLESFPFSINPNMVEIGFAVPLIDECVCGHVEAEHKERGCRFRPTCGCTEYRPAFVFWGRADAVVQAQHDLSLYVLDHKTTGRITSYWADQFLNDSQMSGYIWAIQKTLGQHLAGIFINAIEFSVLPGSNRKCNDHGTVYAECGPMHMKEQLLVFTRSPTQLDQWHRDAVRLARQYQAILDATESNEDVLKQPMRGTFHKSCTFCDFKRFCQAERPMELIDSMLEYRPWVPFELKEKENAA